MRLSHCLWPFLGQDLVESLVRLTHTSVPVWPLGGSPFPYLATNSCQMQMWMASVSSVLHSLHPRAVHRCMQGAPRPILTTGLLLPVPAIHLGLPVRCPLKKGLFMVLSCLRWPLMPTWCSQPEVHICEEACALWIPVGLGGGPSSIVARGAIWSQNEGSITLSSLPSPNEQFGESLILPPPSWGEDLASYTEPDKAESWILPEQILIYAP